MGFFADFKAFAMRGNVIDLAVGVIIGGAFGQIVTSLVNDLMMPPLGLVTQGNDLKERFVCIAGCSGAQTIAAAKAAKETIITYGNFFAAAINFIIIAFAIFLLIRLIGRLLPAPPPPPPPGPSAQEKLLTEIRDLLAARKP